MDTIKKVLLACAAISIFAGGAGAVLSSLDSVLASRVKVLLASEPNVSVPISGTELDDGLHKGQ